MLTSSNGDIICVTDPLCGEFTSHRWVPLTKGQWCGDLVCSLICTWINGWVNNGEAGYLRRDWAHYDIIVMLFSVFWRNWCQNSTCMHWYVWCYIIGTIFFIRSYLLSETRHVWIFVTTMHIVHFRKVRGKLTPGILQWLSPWYISMQKDSPAIFAVILWQICINLQNVWTLNPYLAIYYLNQW